MVDTALGPPPPLWTGELFAGLHAELIRLLRGLEPGAWSRPTSAGGWHVRDVVAHVLDGELRTVSFLRDGHTPLDASAARDYGSLVAFLDDANRGWVDAARRISGPVLADLLEPTGRTAAECLRRLDPDGSAPYPVAWAGQDASPCWLHVGREYTERWHHQDQIREAVGAPPLDEAHWLRPVVEISMYALPHAYRAANEPAGTAVAFEVTGDAGGSWSLVRRPGGWTLMAGEAPDPAARVITDALTAARILLHRIPVDAALRRLRIEGVRPLGERLARARAVMVAEPADVTESAAPGD